jgi:large subunit ribosomal protein L14e
MSALDVGMVCVKMVGKEKGKRYIIVDVIDKSFVLVAGLKASPGTRRHRANVRHLKPTGERLEISREASDEEAMTTVKARI